MAPKGGILLLLFLVCAPLDGNPLLKPGGSPPFQDMAKRMMRMCHNKGYPVPAMLPMTLGFNSSDSPTKDRDSGQSSTVLSFIQNMLNSVSPGKDLSRIPMDDSDKMPNMMVNCSKLTAMINKMRNSSEESACYVHAFVGPLSWAALTGQSDGNMESGDYKTLLQAAESTLPEMPASRMNLPNKTPAQKMKRIMTMLKEVYKSMSEAQRMKVVKWGKNQIMQNDFNCTVMSSSDSDQGLMQPCNSSVKWLRTEALTMMGPYLCNIAPKDVDSAPNEELCDFFRSAKFKYALTMAAKMKPTLAKRFLRRFQGCFNNEEEFLEHVDKLSTLACHYDAVRGLSPDVSRKLLDQMNDCDDGDNPRIKMMKKLLLNSVLSNSAQTLPNLGSCIALLTPEQLSKIPDSDLQSLGSSVQWSKQQQRALVRKKLGGKKCKKLSLEELMALQSVAAAVPSCVLKLVKAQAILDNREAMKNISRKMRKTQLTAMLQGLSEDANPSELLRKLSGPLRRMVSLSFLDKVNITSLDKSNETWTLPQAAYLAKKMFDQRKLRFRELQSLLQGVTCKMIDSVTDGDVPEMAWAMTNSQRWLSKVQARCAAIKLFMTLEKERADYFKTITEDELDGIPTVFLIHLPPQKVLDLPESVCRVFLDKMEMANMSTLPRKAPSRLALARKALLCLAKGTDLSSLTSEDVSSLGPLLCEVQPSQLRLMPTDVLRSSLRAMASCQHIPPRHRADLMQLVTTTFGNPSNWPPETMEELGPLVLMDDDVTSALPNTPWMKDVLAFLKPRLWHISKALKKKLFSLTTTTSTFTNNTDISTNGSNTNTSINGTSTNTTRPNVVRRRRAVSNNGNSNSNKEDGLNSTAPTVELIEDLGMDNVFWTAAQLDLMSVDTFRSTVETLGKVTDYSAAQLAVLRQKATEAYGSELQSESVVTQLGCISQGFSSAQLQTFQFSLDYLEDIAACGWNTSQLAAVWKGAAAYNNLTGAQALGAVEMVGLNRFICGLNSNEISQLSISAFRNAVGSMNLQCSYEVLQHFKSLAVSAFGDPHNWTTAQVSDLSNIIAGLNSSELASLDLSVFPYLSESCIPLIPPENFAALSAAQLKALGPDNAAMLTTEQRAALTDEQRVALEEAETGSRGQDGQTGSTESGAPSLSVEGVSAFMKPLLFLLTGFLLL